MNIFGEGFKVFINFEDVDGVLAHRLCHIGFYFGH